MKCPMEAHFMSKNLKKPTTYNEQIDILKKRGLVVNNEDEARIFLSNVNYYRSTGYLLPFTKQDRIYDLDFERFRDIYYFDAEMRNLLYITIEKIEISLRTKLSYYSAHKYGALGYMDSSNYNRKHNHSQFDKLIKSSIKENRNSPVIRHHENMYGGQFPIWVMIDYFTLGMLSHFYTDMKNADKTSISIHEFGVNYQTLSSWLKCLADLRNRCAHYSRLYYWKFPSIPKQKTGDDFVYDQGLFSQIYFLKYLYPERDRWEKDFVKPLIKLVNKYKKSIKMDDIGFPYRWKYYLRR